MTILPPNSINKLLPKDYREVYKAKELKQYYPEDFEMDLNGRSTPWEAIILIPFVDEAKLFQVESQFIEEGLIHLTKEETRWNSLGQTLEFVWNDQAETALEIHTFEGLNLEDQKTHSEIKDVTYFTRNDLVFSHSQTSSKKCIDFPSLNYLDVVGVKMEAVKNFNTEFYIPKLKFKPKIVNEAWLT